MIYIVILILLVTLVAWYLSSNKRKVPVTDVAAPKSSYKDLLNAHVEYYNKLNDADQLRFERLISEFLTEVNVEGVGVEVTDVIRILVAASAIIPVFGFKEWRYQNLTNVIVYPDTFDAEYQFEGENRNIMGMVGTGYMNGQMLLSYSALLKGFSKSSGKENTGIHEFVHLLDKSDGATDGVPENMMSHEYATPWLQMMHKEMHRIKEGKSDINPYALTNEAEFLAVASEYFFEKPDQFKAKHPELYEQLSQVFRQEPAND
ncbi:zinc-dependent peptidase [Mucilaginibacter sp. KACC 22063]|uniref:M90 family metallopeptidase n=1 Tax=Mucilaginibacter sp. KACC 22063 TaxID=3025666 RepID=UPI002366EF59|nr:M90 family metallopeptidase [Mucilaginibacter sp. KACC 22063]WDF54278.1 zinc-dependent peptidase [Mucilaginibacter sp. KACC 22063]